MKKHLLNQSNKKFEFIKSPFLILVSLGIAGLFLRIYYFPYGIPIANDGYLSLIYAIDMSRIGYFPTGYMSTNTGWANILALVFSVFKFQSPLDYMNMQRSLSILVSVITIIPLYLLCSRFFEKKYAIVGTALFLFDPRIIQNSLLGLDYPVFILFMTTTLFLFLSKNDKLIYISFAVLAFASIIRYEALLMIIPFSIIFYFRFRNEKRVLLKILLVLSICALILLPIGYFRSQTGTHDGLITNVIAGPKFVSNYLIQDKSYDDQTGVRKQNSLTYFIITSLNTFIILFGKSLIPTFILFIIFSLFLIIKNRDHIKKDYKIITIIFFAVIVLLPALYAYGRGIQESRYLFILFPVLCILSIYSIKGIGKRCKNEGIVLVLIISGILLSSLIFLDYEKIDYNYERELFSIAERLVDVAGGVNDYPRAGYFKAAELFKEWPELPPKTEKGKIAYSMIKIPVGGSESLEEYLTDSKQKGLTHLVVMKNDKVSFLNDVFEHEKNYPFLLKIYDSKEHGLKMYAKIYKINYEQFETLQ